jgi:hypothetical protein
MMIAEWRMLKAVKNFHRNICHILRYETFVNIKVFMYKQPKAWSIVQQRDMCCTCTNKELRNLTVSLRLLTHRTVIFRQNSSHAKASLYTPPLHLLLHRTSFSCWVSYCHQNELFAWLHSYEANQYRLLADFPPTISLAECRIWKKIYINVIFGEGVFLYVR